MSTIEQRWRTSVTRREALLSLAGMLASSPFLGAQHDPRPLRDHRRVPGFDEMATAFDFEPICFANMTRNNYDYMAHGDGDEFTLRRNREAFGWVDLVERPGASIDALDTTRVVLGLTLDVPILISPSTRQRDASPAPRYEWKGLIRVFPAEDLAELLHVSLSSLKRYQSGERDTPDDIAARLHFLALVVGDLAGSYNETGIRRWFQRKRTRLDGRSPAALLKPGWDPDQEGPMRVRALARELVALSAT